MQILFVVSEQCWNTIETNISVSNVMSIVELLGGCGEVGKIGRFYIHALISGFCHNIS